MQIPIDIKLRKKAEGEAEMMGFSSLQEMIRVLLTQIVNKRMSTELKDLCEKYGINYLGLFGSVARGEAKKNSDIDLLVKFRKDSKVGLFELDDLQKEFENKFGRKVDLVTKMNKYIKPYVAKDLRTIYEKE